jgi:hypothetical protein
VNIIEFVCNFTIRKIFVFAMRIANFFFGSRNDKTCEQVEIGGMRFENFEIELKSEPLKPYT